ncbi:MAG: AsmA-like C-terminal domain-containing protein [Thermoguttaceae bacterium]|nr:AsmA-like C-terminal domain-containing protein [Thermoguttaceae bacterium]
MSKPRKIKTPRKRTALGAIKRFLGWSLFLSLLALGVVGGIVYKRGGTRVRGVAEKALQASFPSVETSFDSLRLDPRGARLTGVKFARRDAGASAPALLEVEEIALDGQLDASTLFGGVFAANRVVLRRPVWRTGITLANMRNDIEALAPNRSSSDAEFGEIEIVDATVELKSGTGSGSKSLRGINATLKAEGDDWTIQIAISNPTVEAIDAEALVSSVGWSAKGSAKNLDFSAALELISEIIPTKSFPLKEIQGKTSLDFAIEGDFESPGDFRYRIDGAAVKCAATTPALKYPLSDVEARYAASNEGASVEKFSARCGAARFESSYLRRGSFKEPKSETIRTRIENFRLDSATIRGALADAEKSGTAPKETIDAIRGFVDDYEFSATVDVDAELEKRGPNGDWAPKELKISGTDADVLCKGFPYPLERLAGTVSLDAKGAIALDLAEGSGDAEPGLRIVGKFSDALSKPKGSVEIVAKDRSIDAKLLAAIPESRRKALESLRPAGRIDARLRITYDRDRYPEDPLRLEARFDVRDGSLTYEYFPLPIASIAGSLYMRDNAWIFSDLTGKSGAASIRGSGSLIDGKRLKEIEEEFRANASRAGEEGASFADAPTDDDSPAPLELFASVPIATDPPLAPDATRFQLTTDVQNFPLGDELRSALVHYAGREDFERLNLEGRANGQIRTAHRTDVGKLTLEFEARPTKGSTSARPAEIPYELRDIEGLFVYREGALNVEGFRARSGRATISANIKHRELPDKGWAVDFSNLRIDQFQFDRDLQSAASGEALKLIGFVNPSGSFNIDGALRLVKEPGERGKTSARWDLRIAGQQNSARPGIQLDAICGSIKTLGSASTGAATLAYGEFDLDSLYYKEMQIADLKGPFYFDGGELFWGRDAPAIRRTPLYQDGYLRERIDADPKYKPRDEARGGQTASRRGERVAIARAQEKSAEPEPPGNRNLRGLELSEALAASDGRRPVLARAFDGTLVSDGSVAVGETATYRFTATLLEGKLAAATRYFAPGTKPLKGIIDARANLRGEGRSIQTLKGDGEIEVREAELYELPQIVKILQILSVRDSDKSAFSRARARFEAAGDRLNLKNVLLEGDALTLFGEGWIAFKGQENLIDLELNSRLGNAKNQIPVISDVIGEVGDQIAQIRVEGNLKSPVIHQEAAPGVKKAWWSVFPEREPEPTDKTPIEKARPFRDMWKKMTGGDKENQ